MSIKLNNAEATSTSTNENLASNALISSALVEPDKFNLVQLVRVINRYLAKAATPFDLVIEADAMPNNFSGQITALSFEQNKATITSSQTSLSSGNAVVPLYIYETLLTAFHQEQYALTDFLNIFNNRYFKLFARTVEQKHLLLVDEIDRFFQDNTNQKQQHISLANCIAQIAGLPNNKQTNSWLGYGLILGSPNRSIKSLQQVLCDFFSLAITVKSEPLTQYQLSPQCWTQLGSTKGGDGKNTGKNNQLGQGFLLGKKTWLSNQSINITVQVETAQQLQLLTDDNAWFQELAQMTRYYLRDKTELAIYLEAPNKWFKRTVLSNISDKTVRLGRGFHITSSQQDEPIVYLIHLVKD